jgi:hypothetical protein
MLVSPTAPLPRFSDEHGQAWVSTRGALLRAWTPWVVLVALVFLALALLEDAFAPVWSIGTPALLLLVFAWRFRGSGKHEALAWRINAGRDLSILHGDGSIRSLGVVASQEPLGALGWFQFTSFTHWTWRFPKQQFRKGGRTTGIIGKLISPLFSLGFFGVSGDLMVGDFQGRYLLFWPCLRRPETCALVTMATGEMYILTARTPDALASGITAP